MRFSVKEAPRAATLSVDIPNVKADEDFIELLDKATSPKELSFLVQNIGKAFKNGHEPIQVEQCTSGTYFLEDSAGHFNGVFKPLDEEPNDVIKGVQFGEATVRECAAYYLDHDHFAAVPPTDLVVCQHSSFHNDDVRNAHSLPGWAALVPELGATPARAKLGSFQEYQENDGDFDEMSRRSIAEFPTREVQKVAVLDIRLCNTDRHGGNLLFRLGPKGLKSSATIIPIDHGYTLPSTLDEALFVWLDWPQVACKMLPEVKQYIAKLDVEADICMLQQRFPDCFGEEHFRIMRLMMMLLKKGAAVDFTLAQIGRMVCRLDYNAPSALETIIAEFKAKHGSLPIGTVEPMSPAVDDYILSLQAQSKAPDSPTASRTTSSTSFVYSPRETSTQSCKTELPSSSSADPCLNVTVFSV